MIKLLIFVLIVLFAVIGMYYVFIRLFVNYIIKSKGFEYWPKNDEEMKYITESSVEITEILSKFSLRQRIYTLQRIIALFEWIHKIKIPTVKYKFKFGEDKEAQRLYELLWAKTK